MASLLGSALWILLLGGGCSSGAGVDPRELLTREVSGTWASTAAVGSLGRLELALLRRADSRVYDAEINSQSSGTFEAVEGYGTLADSHLILDFGTGTEGEFYFEGLVTGEGLASATISGQFIFPGQAETLPVTFFYQGPLTQ